MKVLGIETSCDETAIAVVEDGCRILSNVVASQVDLHTRYGGIVPEVASRQHILALVPTLRETLKQGQVSLPQVEAVAVTQGPGLAGSLLTGVNFAKCLSLAIQAPFIGINHLEGHIYAAWLQEGPPPDQEPGFPLMCLIASGGHTDLVLMRGHGEYTLLGRTRDDAAGEAFDKAARVLGLGFPGGPYIQQAAEGAQGLESLPKPLLKDTLDFSFSGLKTALLRRVQAQRKDPNNGQDPRQVTELAFAFQESLAQVMVEKTLGASRQHSCRGIIVGGGVAANARLRQLFRERSRIPVLIPQPSLCTDNGAMIAGAAFFRLRKGERHDLDLDLDPGLRLG
ncbi:MAG: tRNA (adenosine(37)-N6)-threonylcarbamoyltransferase complex transferase subunit TsaD [Chloroflexi bacterium]|nr:tRNA (adenosine(37)-N6)-threonylcarbamoyltransferase complex transferase subunit TsaD [Chloroflexota bacterium]